MRSDWSAGYLNAFHEGYDYIPSIYVGLDVLMCKSLFAPPKSVSLSCCLRFQSSRALRQHKLVEFVATLAIFSQLSILIVTDDNMESSEAETARVSVGDVAVMSDAELAHFMQKHRLPSGDYDLPIDGWDTLSRDDRSRLAEKLE